MGVVNLPDYGTDPATVNAANLDAKVNPLATEFNGNIENVNVKTGANIAAAKLDLSTIAQDIAMSSSQILWAKGADVASGTSIALGTDGNVFDITGTTTIQTITAKQAGSVVILHFDGALTLTDDTGNLELQGNDLAVSAEDEVMLKSDGTNWHLVSSSIRGTGSFNYVSTTAISNDATIEVTGLASGYDYMFSFQNLAPQNDNTKLLMRTSTDGGSTYDSGASDYQTDSGSASSMNAIGGTMGNASNESTSTDIIIFNPGGSSAYTQISTSGCRVNPSGNTVSEKSFGQRNSTGDVDAVEFRMDSGNLASGNLRIFRRKLSA